MGIFMYVFVGYVRVRVRVRVRVCVCVYRVHPGLPTMHQIQNGQNNAKAWPCIMTFLMLSF